MSFMRASSDCERTVLASPTMDWTLAYWDLLRVAILTLRAMLAASRAVLETLRRPQGAQRYRLV